MSSKYELLLAFLSAWVHLGSAVELTVTCNHLKNTCIIKKLIELPLNDTLKFIVDDAKTSADKLKALNIPNNNIAIIPNKVFFNLPNVEKILLSNSKVEIIEDDAFDGMMNLVELNLEENLLKSIGRSTFTGAPKIKSLNLRSNKIERIEEGALNLPNLENLYLSHNQLTTLSDSLLVGAENLYKLFFNQNKITHIGKALNDCNKLGILNLNENPVEDIELSTLAALKNLNTLYLENIGLKLPEEIPSPTPNESKLKNIWLAGNDLSNPEIFKHLSVFGQLENIHLLKNKFTVFNDVDKIRNYFPELKRLSLADNEPSLCDWIQNNEQYLKHISVRTSTKDGCQFADFQEQTT